MANNYTQFSFAITLETDEQWEWARAAVEAMTLFIDLTDDELESHPMKAIFPSEDFCGAGYAAEVDTDGLWIYADDSGNPDDVVPLVQEFLRKFRPDAYVSFEWADTCSKMRLNEFGGGAMVIFADEVHGIHTSQWISDLLQERGRIA